MQSTRVDGLIPISMAMLSPSVLPGLDIYLRSNAESNAVLFCASDELPELSRLAPLVQDGHNKLFIDRCDRHKYQEYLRTNWEVLLADETQPLTNRMAVMSEVMRDVLSEDFASRDTQEIVLASKRLGKGSCKLLGDRPVVMRQMCSVLHHDYATFTHSTNVSLFSVILARELGFEQEELEEIAVGALLHDIGKLHIDDRILTKPGRLDEFEFREIKKHPVTGFDLLVDRSDLTLGQLMMTYQHHERLDGSGYPVGCMSQEIHPYAKICAIVDVYEALTSHRPYRASMCHKTAMTILEQGDGTEFDSEILRCWHHLAKKTH